MSISRVSLDNVRSLHAVLTRLPQGTQARELAASLGLWSNPLHSNTNQRQQIHTALSKLSDGQLSDVNGYWLSEIFRTTELVGLLDGLKTMLTIESKGLRSTTRARLRRAHRQAATTAAEKGDPVPKDPTAAQLADEVDEDSNVQEHDQTMALLGVVMESAKAYKEACQAMAAGVSREISFRQAQMSARLR